MNAPSSPMNPFTSSASAQINRSSISADSHPITALSRSRPDAKPVAKPVRIDRLETRPRRYSEEDVPDVKRRRVSHTTLKPVHAHRDRSPEITYPISPYNRPEPHHPSPLLIHSQRFGSISGSSHPDPSLKLPPLKTTTPVTPSTPFSQDGSSVEATVMTIPFLNKIKVLAKISPPLVPSFRDTSTIMRGPVISIDGQDPHLVQIAVTFLERLLKKESKYQVRVFPGPDISGAPDGGQMGDATVDYLNTISAWHRISDEVVSFVKSAISEPTDERRASDADSRSSHSLKTTIHKTANLQIDSPTHSSDDESETNGMSSGTNTNRGTIPIAMVPRYQLTIADAFACSIPIHDSYAPLDHWQWMASLWRACVGPDITVYIRECTKDELDQAGGNPVEVRLQDARTIILRKVAGTPRELEEKALKRVGFEIEDFLAG